MTVTINGDTGISPVTASGTSASVDGMTVGKGASELSNNTAVGYVALNSATTGNYNSAIGWGAAQLTTTGSANTTVGDQSLRFNTTGSYNTALGGAALNQNTTASNNTAVGYQSLYANTASNNTAVGYIAMQSNTTGALNVAVGQSAMGANTTGDSNVAIGFQPLNSNTTGSNNVAIGRNALAFNTTASNNTAVGYQAGYSNVTGGSNVLIGRQAGYSSTAGVNVCIGDQAGYNLTTGQYNTFIGSGSLSYGVGALMTTGSKNTIIGAYSGNQGGLDIRTASNYIVLSDGDGNPRQIIDNNGAALINRVASSQYTKLAVAGAIRVNNNTDQSADNTGAFGMFFAKGTTTVTGGAGATAIKPATGSEAAFYLVTGFGESNKRFYDIVVTLGALACNVIASGGANTPPTRTYTSTGETLYLSITGTSAAYSVRVTGFGANESA